MREKKKKKGIILILMIFVITQILTPIGKVQAYTTGDYVEILAGGSYPCMYWGNSFSAIEYFTYKGEEAYYPAYRLTYDGNPLYRDRTTIMQGELQEEEIQKIVMAGYPYHSYSELGCQDAYQAYMATQLVILEYTQGEDLSLYRPCEQRGQEVENAIQVIRNNRAMQGEVQKRPQIYFVADSDWEVYEYDTNYYVKRMHLETDQPSFSQWITLTSETENVRIVDETNFERQTFLPYQSWKILMPVDALKEVSILGEVCVQTYPMQIATSTENGEGFILTQDTQENVQVRYIEIEDAPVVTPENPVEDDKNTQSDDEKVENPEEGENTEEDNKEDSKEDVEKDTDKEKEESAKQESIEIQNQSENINNNENNNQNENKNEIQVVNQNQNEKQIDINVPICLSQKEIINVSPVIQIVWKQEEMQLEKENEKENEKEKEIETEKETKIEENSNKELQNVSTGITFEKTTEQTSAKTPSSLVVSKALGTGTKATMVTTTQKTLPRTGY